jgi:hypothetical protein
MVVNRWFYIKILILILVISLVFSFFRKNTAKTSDSSNTPQLLVATDPSFPEVAGRLIEGFPSDFPIYPGGVLIASAKINPPNVPDQGYRAKWELVGTQDTTSEVVSWYKDQLVSQGWGFIDPSDPEGLGELIAHIEKQDEYEGYVAAEIEGEDEIEIVVNLRIK